jgi:hypothetical protein
MCIVSVQTVMIAGVGLNMATLVFLLKERSDAFSNSCKPQTQTCGETNTHDVDNSTKN